MGGGASQPGALDELLTVEAPDVIVLQESGREVLRFDAGLVPARRGRNVRAQPFPDPGRGRARPERRLAHGRLRAIIRYTLDTPLGRVDLTNVHLETPREGLEAILGFGPGAAAELEAKNAQRLIEARLAREWVDASVSSLRLVAGDFNTPVESHLFRDRWRDFRDCHSAAGWGFGFTKHTRRIGTRIDHVLDGRRARVRTPRASGRARGGATRRLVVEIGHGAPVPPNQAGRRRPRGSSRRRSPVAAKIALATAGATGGTPGSPTPAGGAVALHQVDVDVPRRVGDAEQRVVVEVRLLDGSAPWP